MRASFASPDADPRETLVPVVMTQECKYGALKSSPDSVPWLARLALTRSTVFMPMTNAIGYFKNDR